LTIKIEIALISVYDKSKLVDLLINISKKLDNLQILSTGGTLRQIKENWNKMYFKDAILSVEDYTSSPEFPNGLVKTLHPKIFFGLLGDNSDKEHSNYYNKYQIKPINLLICNFYPFEEFLERNDRKKLDYKKFWDIGGPSMVMASIKGGHCLTLTNPSQYKRFEAQVKKNGSQCTSEFLKEINIESIRNVARYHELISNYYEEL
jgi:phosphoribosylaminoimidazolecarboxamide formyltransferase/IMP cyclohydrolase